MDPAAVELDGSVMEGVSSLYRAANVLTEG